MAEYTDKKIRASECRKRGAVHGLYETTTYPDISQNNMLLYAVGDRHYGLHGVWNPRTNTGVVFNKTILQFSDKNRTFHKSKIMEA